MQLVNLLPKKFFLTTIFFVFSLFLLLPPSFAQEFAQDEIVVKMRPSISSDERLKFHYEIDVQSAVQIQNIGVDVLHFGRIDINRTIERLKLDPRVLYAEPNYKATVFEMTNDPALVQNLQWGLNKIKVAGTSDSGWNITHGNSWVKVAVLDTGIDLDHEDLKVKVISSKNCTDSNTAKDIYGHGTHVSGIISANTNNNQGVAGVGYNISLINAKGLGDDGLGYYSWLANCLVWATDNGANVINMSLGGLSDSQLLFDAINYAWNKGVVLVAAAGNSGSNSPSYPAFYPHVLSVAATDSKDNMASFSNFGSWVKVAAPGVSIYSTLPIAANAFKQTGYGYASGTSMAAPFVTGLAGLLFSLGSPDNTTILKQIEDNADKIAGTGTNWVYGRINAYQSLLAAGGISSSAPSITPTFTSIPMPTSTPSPSLTPIPTPTSTPIPTPTSTLVPTITSTPTPVPTSIPTPTPITNFIPPKAPSSSKPPWLTRICSRFPFLCN